MIDSKLPAYISHTVLVHAGSYKNFLSQVATKFPQLKIKFTKRIYVHYYIIQLEDTGEIEIKKKQIYSLPIMAMREEFSSYAFFKSVKNYNSVLKRMCNGDNNKNVVYDLLQHMMTPFEKSKLLKLDKAKTLTIEEETEKEILTTSYYGEALKSMEVLEKIFLLNKVKVDKHEIDFDELVKKEKWRIGIYN